MSEHRPDATGDAPISIARAAIERLAYSPSEAATALGVTRATVYRLIESGKLRAFKAERRTLIPVADVRRLVGLDAAA